MSPDANTYRATRRAANSILLVVPVLLRSFGTWMLTVFSLMNSRGGLDPGTREAGLTELRAEQAGRSCGWQATRALSALPAWDGAYDNVSTTSCLLHG